MRSSDETGSDNEVTFQTTKGLLRALDAFTRSESWHEAKQVVEAHRELLTEEADVILLALIAKQTDRRAIQILQEHRQVLAQCRVLGIDAAFADRLVGNDVPPEGIDPVLWVRLQAADSYQALLALITEYPELVTVIKQRMAEVLGDMQIPVVNAIEIFLSANTWAEARDVILAYPVLFTLDADIWLMQYIQFVELQGEWDIAEALIERRWLLARCRMEGVERVFRRKTIPQDGVRLEMEYDLLVGLLSGALLIGSRFAKR